MNTLREHPAAGEVVAAIDQYLPTYGHQGYSLDFVEPTQAEDPAGPFATLKAMVGDQDYDPEHQRAKAAAIREEKLEQISELLSGLEYWQFRYRLWLARRYAPVRDEVSFLLGSCWSVVRPMAFELGRSSGQVTAKASVVMGPADFAKMEPGSILVSPLTTPAWTQLFAHAASLVTDRSLRGNMASRQCWGSVTAPSASRTVS